MTSTGVNKNAFKVVLVTGWLLVSIVGFMVKLPRGFRHYDKELHAAFYFMAAAFLNILFANGKFTRHILIFGLLLLFSVTIEYAQEYSNKLLRKRIHGRFDPEDVKYNLRGLIGFSLLWVPYWLVMSGYNRFRLKEAAETGAQK